MNLKNATFYCNVRHYSSSCFN